MVLLSWNSLRQSSTCSYDECRTAPDGRRRLDQANRLGPLVRLNMQLASTSTQGLFVSTQTES